MVRFGIMGAGKIAKRFAASLSQVEDAELVAVSCRSAEKAAEWVGTGSVSAESAYAGEQAHTALLSDNKVDAVYIALPHFMHYWATIEAFKAGKAVLCEKPAMLDAEQMAYVMTQSHQRGLLFMEAMKPRFVPLYLPIMRAIGELGELTRVDVSLCNDMLADLMATPTYHLQGPGAGVLLDCGTYCASWIEALFPEGAEVVHASSTMIGEADIHVEAELQSGSCKIGFECAFDCAKPRNATIAGSKGQLIVEELHRPQEAVCLIGGDKKILRAPYVVDDFYGEITHFCELLRAGEIDSPLMSQASSLRVAKLLDALKTQ